MSALLDLPEIRRHLTPFSVEEYHRWGKFHGHGRCTELIHGFILQKAVLSPPHSFYVTRAFRLADAATRTGTYARQEQPLTFADSEPEPDVAVVEGRLEDHFETHPTTARLVVEVALTSESLDRRKAELYAEADILEYWLVLPEERVFEVHTRPRAGRYTRTQTYGGGETVACGTVPDLRVVLNELFRADGPPAS